MSGRPKRVDSAHFERGQELGRVLHRQRTEVLKLSRQELARRASVAPSTIQAIEDGRSTEPSVFTVIALAVALNLDLGSMMSTLTGPIRPRPLRVTESAPDNQI